MPLCSAVQREITVIGRREGAGRRKQTAVAVDLAGRLEPDPMLCQ